MFTTNCLKNSSTLSLSIIANLTQKIGVQKNKKGARKMKYNTIEYVVFHFSMHLSLDFLFFVIQYFMHCIRDRF